MIERDLPPVPPAQKIAALKLSIPTPPSCPVVAAHLPAFSNRWRPIPKVTPPPADQTVGGGIGDGPPGIAYAREANVALRTALQTMSEACKKKFGLSTQRAIAHANKMVFHDGRLPGLMSYSGGTGDWDKMSFEEYYRARRRPLFATNLNDQNGNPSASVVLWGNFFGVGKPNSLSQQRITLVHEFAHSFLGIADHDQLIRALGIARTRDQYATEALDKALEKCWE